MHRPAVVQIGFGFFADCHPVSLFGRSVFAQLSGKLRSDSDSYNIIMRFTSTLSRLETMHDHSSKEFEIEGKRRPPVNTSGMAALDLCLRQR